MHPDLGQNRHIRELAVSKAVISTYSLYVGFASSSRGPRSRVRSSATGRARHRAGRVTVGVALPEKPQFCPHGGGTWTAAAVLEAILLSGGGASVIAAHVSTVEIPDADRRELQRRARSKGAPPREVERARIVLLAGLRTCRGWARPRGCPKRCQSGCCS